MGILILANAVVLAQFTAKTFEELFQGVYNSPLELFIPRDGQFPVKGHCLNSQLMSVPDCQAIIKKAASRRLGEKYGVNWLPETSPVKYQLHFTILNDQVTLSLDTSGQGLHKRGYRAVGNDAPLHETLAAGMIQLTRYRGREFFWDPFCGSGTIVIEAALAALNRAPGLYREFGAQKWACVPGDIWQQVKTEAKDKEFNGKYRIMGSDNDGEVKSLMPPANSSQHYFLGWAGQNKASWVQPKIAAAAPVDSDGKKWRLYIDPATYEPVIVKES